MKATTTLESWKSFAHNHFIELSASDKMMLAGEKAVFSGLMERPTASDLSRLAAIHFNKTAYGIREAMTVQKKSKITRALLGSGNPTSIEKKGIEDLCKFSASFSMVATMTNCLEKTQITFCLELLALGTRAFEFGHSPKTFSWHHALMRIL